MAVRAAAAGSGRRSKLRDPWLRVDSARPLLDPGPVDADAAKANKTVDTQAVQTIAVTWYCVSVKLSSAPKGRAALSCTRLQLLEPLNR